MRICVYLAACCFLASCSQNNDPETKEFLSKIMNALGSGAKEVKVSRLTDFDWNEVCHLDGGDNSLDPPYVKKFIAARGLDNPEGASDLLLDFRLKKEAYKDAFIFSKDKKVVKVFRILSHVSNTLIAEQEQCIGSDSATFGFETRSLAGYEHQVITFKRMEE